jgi:hypothetical protein
MKAGFVKWLEDSRDQLDVDFSYLLPRNHPALSWFRQVYDDLGPIPSSQLRQLLEQARSRSARLALEIMKGEVRFYHRKMFEAEIEEGPSDSVEGGRGYFFLGVEVSSWTVEYALIEIGDTVQSEIIDRDWQVWPICDVHGCGLHLKETEEQVVWWCRPGRHALRTVYPA